MPSLAQLRSLAVVRSIGAAFARSRSLALAVMAGAALLALGQIPARASSPPPREPLQLTCTMTAAKGAKAGLSTAQACAMMRQRLTEGLGRPVSLVSALPRQRSGDWIVLRLEHARPASLMARMQASIGGATTQLPEIGVDVNDRDLRSGDMDRLARAVASAAQGLTRRQAPR